jgi:hypothetical protein
MTPSAHERLRVLWEAAAWEREGIPVPDAVRTACAKYNLTTADQVQAYLFWYDEVAMILADPGVPRTIDDDDTKPIPEDEL